jgi:hypothetical protein
MNALKGFVRSLAAVGAMAFMAPVQAGEIRYDTWSTDEGTSGNYQLTVNDDGGRFNFDLTVDPWNAEAFGLFVDFGGKSAAGAIDLQGDSNVTSAWANLNNDSCGGQGCNVNGLSNYYTSDFDGEWGLVFRFGQQGFEELRSFSWSTSMMGVGLEDFGLVAVRAQNQCSGDNTLDNGDDGCDGSDKSFGFSSPIPVTEPGMLGLMGLGLLMLGFRRHKAD